LRPENVLFARTSRKRTSIINKHDEKCESLHTDDSEVGSNEWKKEFKKDFSEE
jgi:predicted AAA+ superfamily ATPase